MSARYTQQAFESAMHAALDHMHKNHGAPSERSVDKWSCNAFCKEYTIHSVVHYQGGVKYEGIGYRKIKWDWEYETNTVSITDIFDGRKVVGADSYYSRLDVFLEEETYEGVKTINKAHWYGPKGEITEVYDDTLTYQGYPVDTAEQVVTLLHHIRDMPCHY